VVETFFFFLRVEGMRIVKLSTYMRVEGDLVIVKHLKVKGSCELCQSYKLQGVA